MSNEWFEIAWINFHKAILHGQIVTDAGEREVEIVLTDEQAVAIQDLNERHRAAMQAVLRSIAAQSAA